ncbi:MAG: chemotaxis protein CheX [Gemmatimonadota bacterium]|nr:chemotaxis protein CheX [Gemmatimonadota bacterium]MDH5760590.1 chemotaxis protein CheX [Gemmatimonadota bacterium]
MSLHLDPIPRDVLTEIMSLGVGRAEGALGEFPGRKVRLFVSDARMLDVTRADAFVADGPGDTDRPSVRKNVTGAFEGSALLHFPHSTSLELVRCFVGEDIPLEALEDLRRDAVLEVANVILNACVGAVGDALGVGIATGLPSFVRGSIADRVDPPGDRTTPYGVCTEVRFEVRDPAVTGLVVLVLSVASMEALVETLEPFARHLESLPS